MDRFSRSFKILSRVNTSISLSSDDKENENIGNFSTAKPKDANILKNVSISADTVSQPQPCASTPSSNNLEGTGAINDDLSSSLSSALLNLESECLIAQEMLNIEDLEAATKDFLPSEDDNNIIFTLSISPTHHADLDCFAGNTHQTEVEEPKTITTCEMDNSMLNAIVSQNSQVEEKDFRELSDEEWVGSDQDQESLDEEESDAKTEENEEEIDIQDRREEPEEARNEENEEENDIQGRREGKRKRKKHRLGNPLQWEYNCNKKKREDGDSYCGRKNNKFTVRKEKRQLKRRCLCKKKDGANNIIQCFKLSEDERKSIFTKFWKMTWAEKKIYVNSRAVINKIKRARHRKNENDSRRAYSIEYFLDKKFERIRVCKIMFCNTLGMSVRTISKWTSSERVESESGPAETEEAGPSNQSINCRSLKSNEMRMGIKAFLEQLPKLESHYCRKSTTRLYLEPRFKTKTEVYNFYKSNWCIEKQITPASLTLFMYIFEEMNLSIFSPKKDECDICVGYRTKNIKDEEQYRVHVAKKEEARIEKERDKSSANKVFTMDMQSVLLCPKSNVSALYYRTKLIVHNFTIFDMHTKNGYCFFWHEGEGELKANVFASILYRFLQEEVLPTIDGANKPEIIFYSDGCGAQNRNSLLSNALLNFSIENNICIVQKYLEKGHTQMECDSMHSTIERKLKGRIINVPADYVYLARTARKIPYSVRYLQHSFFKDFSSCNFFNSIRPGHKIGDPTVQNIRALKYNSDGSIEFKIRHTDDFKPLPVRKNKNAKMVPFTTLPNLYQGSLKIKKEKFENLQFLKQTMESDYHDFYDNLQHV